MESEGTDEIRQRMIAALYGELSPDETREFEASLERDEALREEWEELQGARAFLGQSAIEDPSPSFVFLGPTEPVAAHAAQDSYGQDTRQGFWSGILTTLRSPAAGLAVASAALVVLILAGLRVDRTGDGLVLHFGSPSITTAPQGVPGDGNMPGGYPLEPGGSSVARFAEGAGNAVQPAFDQGQYLTRGEFATYTDELMGAIEAGIGEYAVRRRGELLLMMQRYYDELLQQQRRDRDELNSHVDQLWGQLVTAGQTGADEPNLIPNPNNSHGVAPVQRALIRDSGDN